MIYIRCDKCGYTVLLSRPLRFGLASCGELMLTHEGGNSTGRPTGWSFCGGNLKLVDKGSKLIQRIQAVEARFWQPAIPAWWWKRPMWEG